MVMRQINHRFQLIKHLICYYFILLAGIHVHRSSCDTKNSVVLFQAVDSSFFSLWLNWWAVANEFSIIPDYWDVHIACIGDNHFADVISRFHKPGCSQVLQKDSYKKRIYFAKWTAITNAFREGKDMLVVDLDAVLIRDPRSTIGIVNHERSSFDIVSSRDHGPPELPYANLWGTGRFCTGFIFFKYSPRVLELVEFSFNRCNKYGHDQIQFNNALTRSGLAWNEPKSLLDTDQRCHDAVVPWTHQSDPDFVLFDHPPSAGFWDDRSMFQAAVRALIQGGPLPKSVKLHSEVNRPNRRLEGASDLHVLRESVEEGLSAKNRNQRRDNRNNRQSPRARGTGRKPDPHKSLVQTDLEHGSVESVDPSPPLSQTPRTHKGSPEAISVRLLDRWSVLRYCSVAQHRRGFLGLDIAPISAEDAKTIAALHCFVETGPLGEQGILKKTAKEDVMDALNYWIIGHHHRSDAKGAFRIPLYDGPIGYINDTSAPSTIAFLKFFVDPSSKLRMRRVWIDGNFSAHVNPQGRG